MIIAVENPIAQHLHVNSQLVDEKRLASPLTWSVRVAGDFMIIMNNQFALPVIVRHPQRFNDSRSFVTAFKRELLQVLEASPIPHAKVQLIRDVQFKNIAFTQEIPLRIQQQLQDYQRILTSHNSKIDWDTAPGNTELTLQIAQHSHFNAPDTDEETPVMELLENYVIASYQLAAHPQLNEHNRTYLYRTKSLNDIMNATAVTGKIVEDYNRYLDYHNKSDRVIDRNTDVATDYLSYCEANGTSIIGDLGIVCDYLLQYEELNHVQLTDNQLKGKVQALHDFACFMRYQELFSAQDFAIFIQSVAQGFKNLSSQQHSYYLKRFFENMQLQAQTRRDSFEHARRYAHKLYRIQVTLAGYEPSMWRELQANGDTRLDQLCYEILASFNANGHHLYELRDQGKRYCLPVLNSGSDNSSSILSHWLGEYQAGTKLTLAYNLGDKWVFNIEIKEAQPQPTIHSDSPKLLDGQGIGIIDDIGGVAGLAQVAKDDPAIDQQLQADSMQTSWLRKIETIKKGYE